MEIKNRLIVSESIIKGNGSEWMIVQKRGGGIMIRECQILVNDINRVMRLQECLLQIMRSVIVIENRVRQEEMLRCVGCEIKIVESEILLKGEKQQLGWVEESEVLMERNVVDGLGHLEIVDSQVEVRKCQFKNNGDYEGGAIHVIRSRGHLMNNRFINNSAMKGGALYLNHSIDILIINNTFINNTAKEGSAIQINGGVSISIVNNSLSCVSPSHSTIDLKSSQQYSKNITINENVFKCDTEWEVYSTQPNITISNASKVYINRLHSIRRVYLQPSYCVYSIQLLNQQSQPIHLPDPSILYSIQPISSSSSSLSIINNTICIHPSLSSLSLSISQPPLVSLPAVIIKTVSKECSPGQFLSKAKHECRACPVSSYSFEPSSECSPCLVSQPFSCLGGDSLITAPNYFRQSLSSDKFIECHVQSICRGGRLTTQCQEGYTGSLCKQCMEGYCHLTSNLCFSCNEWQTLFKTILQLCLLLFLFYSLASSEIRLKGITLIYQEEYVQLVSLKQECIRQLILLAQLFLLITNLFQFHPRSTLQEYLLESVQLLTMLPSRLIYPLQCLTSISLSHQLLLSSLFPLVFSPLLFLLLRINKHLSLLFNSLNRSSLPERRVSSRLSFHPSPSILNTLPPLEPSPLQHLLLHPHHSTPPPLPPLQQFYSILHSVITFSLLDILSIHCLSFQSTNLGSSSSPTLYTIADYSTPFHSSPLYPISIPTLFFYSLYSLKTNIFSLFSLKTNIPLRRLFYLPLLIFFYSSISSPNPQFPLLLILLLILFSLLKPSTKQQPLDQPLLLSELFFIISILFFPQSTPFLLLISLSIYLIYTFYLLSKTNQQIKSLIECPSVSLSSQHIQQSQHSLAHLFTASASSVSNQPDCPPPNILPLSYQLFKQNVYLQMQIALHQQQIETLHNLYKEQKNNQHKYYSRRQADNQESIQEEEEEESVNMSMNQLFRGRTSVCDQTNHFLPRSSSLSFLNPISQALLHLTHRNTLQAPHNITLTISSTIISNTLKPNDYYLAIHFYFYSPSSNPFHHIQLQFNHNPTSLVYNYTLFQNNNHFYDIQFLVKKYDLENTNNLSTQFNIKQEDSEQQLILDLPINLTKFMFFYNIKDFDIFKEKYNKCYVVSKLIDYSEELIEQLEQLKEYFYRWEYLNEDLEEEQDNDLKTKVFGGFEMIILKTFFVYFKLKISQKNHKLLIKMGYEQTEKNSQDNKYKQSILEALIQEFQQIFNL